MLKEIEELEAKAAGFIAIVGDIDTRADDKKDVPLIEGFEKT